MYPNFNKPAFLSSTPTTGFGGFGTTPSTSSTFGQPAATNTSMFSSMQPSGGGLFQPASTSQFNAVPATQSAFGSNLFGQQQQQQQQQPATSSLFGTSNTNAFGAAKPTFGGFGAAAPQNQTGLFGQQQQQQPQQQQTSSLFQSTATPNIFASSNTFGAQPAQLGTVVKFAPVTGTDTMQKNGVAQSISTKHHCITCMKEYESKSFEELRFEDYSCNRKGPQQQQQLQLGGFGSTAGGFGGATATTTNQPSLFGQDNKLIGLGQTSGFAQQPTASTFGQAASGGFGSGLTNPTSTTTSLFGKPTGFGAPVSSNTSTFGFNTGAVATNPFGGGAATNQAVAKPFTQSLFGTSTAQPQQQVQQPSAFGTSVFGQTNTGAQNTGGLFAKPAQPITSGFGNTGQTGGFGGFNPPTTTFQVANNKPNTGFGLFGQTTNTNTVPNAFGQQANQTTGFGANFGKTIVGQSTFGQPTQQQSAFGGLQPQQQQQQQQPGLFGNNAMKPGGLFGNTTNTGGGLFSNTAFPQNQGTFNLQTPQQQQQQQMYGFMLDTQSNEEAKNIQLLATDIIQDGPHIYGLKPILSKSTDSATNPQDLKALLDISKGDDYSKKLEIPTYAKIKVQSPHTKRGGNNSSITNMNNKDFFDANFALKSSRKCLIIKKSSNSPDNNNGDRNDSIYKKYDNELLKEVEETLKKSNLVNAGNDSMVVNLSNIERPPQEIITREVNKTPLSIGNVKETVRGITTSTIIETPSINITSLKPATTQFDVSVADSSINNNSFNAMSRDIGEIDVNEATISTNRDINYESPYGVILSQPEYYMYPPLKELHHYIDDNGDCIVQGLTIGRYGYGNVYFPDPINITNMNFDEIVHFRHREIIIYPDESIKPPVGQGLNRRAQVTLDKIYPRDRLTNNYVTEIDDIARSSFVDKLISVTEKHNSKFVDYRPKTGSWVFKVKHFSKFSFTDSDEEECKISMVNDNNILKEQQNVDVESDTISKVGLGGLSSFTTGKNDTNNDKLQVLMQPHDNINSSEDDSLLLVDWVDDYFTDNDNDNNILHARKSLMKKSSTGTSNSYLQTMKAALFTRQGQDNIKQQQSMIIDDDDDDDKSMMLLSNGVAGNNLLFQGMTINDDPDDDNNIIGGGHKSIVITAPKIYTVPSLLSALPEDYYSNSHLRSYIDLNIFNGDSYKVGWSKGFNFFKLQRIYDFKMSYELNEMIIQSENDDFVMSNLTDALDNALCESDFEFDSNSVPTLKIRSNLNYLKKQTNLFDTSEMNNRYYLSSVWHLCSALWDGNDNTSCTRRQRLSEWFRIFTDNNNNTEYNNLSTDKQAAQNIFDLLTLNKIKSAAQLAADNNFDYLSLLISQLSANELTKEIMRKYLDTYDWQIRKVPVQFRRIYQLLAGIVAHQQLNIYENIDWKRCFGMHLWYIAPAAAPIQMCVKLFQHTFDQLHYATKPHPPYNNNSPDAVTDTNDYDLIYHILLLYSQSTHQLCCALNPSTHTSNSMDYRLSWLLMQLFFSLQVGLIKTNEANYLHMNFASQLEHMQEWKWSVFVLLYLDDNRLKRDLIMRILERNLSIDNNDNNAILDVEDELVNVMKIPSDWIHEVKAYKMLSCGDYNQAFRHFSLYCNWNKANAIFIEKILPNLFINNQFDYLKDLIRCIEPGEKSITNWDSQSGLFSDFLILQQMVIGSDEQELAPVRVRFNSICQRLSRFPIMNDQQRLCVAELSRKCVSLFKVFYKDIDLDAFQSRFVDLVDNLAMPADYKHYEYFYLIGHGTQ